MQRTSNQRANVMSIHRRKDTGAWEVHVGNTRKSSRHWTRADVLKAEQQLTTHPHSLLDAYKKWITEYVPFLGSHYKTERQGELLRPFLKDRTFDDISVVVAEARKQWQALKPATINRRLTILRRLCNLAFDWGWIDQPLGQKVHLLTEQNERHAYLTHEQVDSLAAACTNHDAGDLILFAAYTGLRLSEIFKVTQHDVFKGSLRLNARTKNGHPRSLPLHTKALAVAQRLPLPISRRVLRREWEAARKLTGLTHIHFHDLRHTFASWLVQADVSIQKVSNLLGHRVLQVTMRYAHLNAENYREAIDRL